MNSHIRIKLPSRIRAVGAGPVDRGPLHDAWGLPTGSNVRRYRPRRDQSTDTFNFHQRASYSTPGVPFCFLVRANGYATSARTRPSRLNNDNIRFLLLVTFVRFVWYRDVRPAGAEPLDNWPDPGKEELLRQGPMTNPFRTTRRVEFADTDMAGIVHFANFFRFMEAAEGTCACVACRWP